MNWKRITTAGVLFILFSCGIAGAQGGYTPYRGNPAVFVDGNVRVGNTAARPGSVRYYEDTDNGTNYFETIGASSIGTTYSVIWPTDAPVDLDMLQWTTGGQLVWTAGSGGAPTNATYITEVAEAGLSNEFALASLSSGLLFNTTATGVPSIATIGTTGIDLNTSTLDFDASEVGSVTWGTANVWTFPTSIAFTSPFLKLANGSTSAGALRLYQDTDVSAFYTGFIAPTSALASDQNYQLPSDAPSDGQFLEWNTGGTLEWTTPAGGGTVSGSGTDNHPARWDGTGDIQDTPNWTFADTSGKFAWNSSLVDDDVLSITNSGAGGASTKGVYVDMSATTGANWGVYSTTAQTGGGGAAGYFEARGATGANLAVAGAVASSNNAAYGGYFDQTYLGDYADLSGTASVTPPDDGFRLTATDTDLRGIGTGGDTYDLTSGYTLNFSHIAGASGVSPADSETVYIGLSTTKSTTAGTRKTYIRRAGRLTVAEIYTYADTVAGSNENWSFYIRVNNTTDYLIATVGAATNERVFSNTAMNTTGIALAAGDYIELKMVNPSWFTNPTGVQIYGYVLIQ